MATQWHTAFAFLLRPLLERSYEVLTNLPVGDLPREADVVLLRRTRGETPRFHGLWRQLTKWNVLEYKGPAVSARLDHVDLLVELGLGVHRKLNEECRKSKQERTSANDVSFWYLASRLGRRFLEAVPRRMGRVEVVDQGVWQTSVLDHPMFLVSTLDLVVEPDCLPFHLLGVDSARKRNEVARLVGDHPFLQGLFKDAWASLHPEQLQEFLAMARSTKKGPVFHLMPLVDVIGWDETIRQLGTERLVDELISDEKGKRRILDNLVGSLSPAEVEELRKRLDQPKRKRC